MSDREIIIAWLKRVERRIRANRLFRELTFGTTLFLIFPLGLKAWDLFSPFRARTLSVLFTIWIVGFGAYLVWRLLQKGTLGQAAASVDTKAELHDQIKTALWFIDNPRSSEWVDAQIRRAARDAQTLSLDRLYPRNVPKTSYLAAAMILVFVALNFVPLTWNHNWLTLQAAPAFSLTDKEQEILKLTKELLMKAEKLQQSELAQRLEDIIQQLEQGKIDPAQAAEMLEVIQSLLGEGNLDLGSINDGLEEIAKDLRQSEKTKATADALMEKELQIAADELRKLAEQLEKNTPESSKELEQSLQQASENSRPGLEDLAKDLKEAAESLKKSDEQNAQDALQQAAQELEKLQQKIQAQQLKNQASQQLQSLEQSLRQRLQNGQQPRKDQQQGQPQSAQGEKGQTEQGDSEGSSQDSSLGEESQSDQLSGQPGEAGAAQPGSNEGSGLNPSGQRGGNAPREGAPTELDVKLQAEKLAGMKDQGTKPEDIEEASKRERSRLDYRNVKSELSPAQKDLLNQDRIPWEYRPLIKNYFQAIRPTGGGGGPAARQQNSSSSRPVGPTPTDKK
jgi:hypothetical protein